MLKNLEINHFSLNLLTFTSNLPRVLRKIACLESFDNAHFERNFHYAVQETSTMLVRRFAAINLP